MGSGVAIAGHAGGGDSGVGITAPRAAPLRSPAKQHQATFRAQIQDAGAALTAARGAELQALQQQDREAAAVAMLVEGRASAFIDFFKLTQPAASTADTPAEASTSPEGVQPPHSEPQQGAGGAQGRPAEGLLLLQAQLVRADVALKGGDTLAAFDAFRQLGRYFTQRLQLERAAMFYERCRKVHDWHAPNGALLWSSFVPWMGCNNQCGLLCCATTRPGGRCHPRPCGPCMPFTCAVGPSTLRPLTCSLAPSTIPPPSCSPIQVAKESGWAEGELESSCALGLVLDRLQQPGAAVACYERCLELALAAPGSEASTAHAGEARRTLVHAYAQQVRATAPSGITPHAGTDPPRPCQSAANERNGSSI
jgi:hypothetical protein